MAKIPDRKLWDNRTESYMNYPGIKPVEIEVGTEYELVLVDAPARFSGRCTPTRASVFKTTGRRWRMRARDGSSMFVWEEEILEQIGRQLVVGMPWNYAKVRPGQVGCGNLPSVRNQMDARASRNFNYDWRSGSGVHNVASKQRNPNTSRNEGEAAFSCTGRHNSELDPNDVILP